MYRTILLAYDGSLEGRLALREGALLARQSGARVVLVAVAEPSVSSSFAGSASGVYIPAIDTSEEVREVLDEGGRRLDRMGIAHELRLETGAPVDRITAVAEEVKADLVVVGHHRQGAVSRWLLGSVTAALADTLHCSLLVARLDVPDAALFDTKSG
jgi:nucleotide-binding universal stress UspA family protein